MGKGTIASMLRSVHCAMGLNVSSQFVYDKLKFDALIVTLKISIVAILVRSIVAYAIL